MRDDKESSPALALMERRPIVRFRAFSATKTRLAEDSLNKEFYDIADTVYYEEYIKGKV